MQEVSARQVVISCHRAKDNADFLVAPTNQRGGGFVDRGHRNWLHLQNMHNISTAVEKKCE